jgi:hypothetical protein
VKSFRWLWAPRWFRSAGAENMFERALNQNEAVTRFARADR